MVIECSSCHARFKLADDKIKESGTKVRCTKCREVFTVFPESPPPVVPPVVTVPPVSPVAPVVAPQQDVVASVSSSLAAEMFPPAGDVPVSEEDDWKQEDASNLFSDEFAAEAAASDLDAINFDNIEAPVFSVTSEKNSKFEFSDDSAFAFADLSLESGTEQPYKITETGDGPSFSGESDDDFSADDFPAAPPPPSTEDLSRFNPVTTDDEFTFSGADNLADLSWDEPDANPLATPATAPTTDTGSAPQDTDFDFSSFSFDDIAPSDEADENKSAEAVFRSDATVEISLESETAPASVETRLLPGEDSPSIVSGRQESTPRPTRLIRPRVRPKKKGSSRLVVKIIIIIFLGLAAAYGFKYRDQIQKTYKNTVSSFIENQSRVETNGRIGLVKLSGSYAVNSREGDLFVIRGEAVNEFKELRSSVLVRGTIYGDNGAALQSQSAYCGNPLPDSSLKNLGFNEIRNIMSNELGENLVNLNIATGKGVPFTIVFSKVPKNIKEFTVEVLESKPGSK